MNRLVVGLVCAALAIAANDGNVTTPEPTSDAPTTLEPSTTTLLPTTTPVVTPIPTTEPPVTTAPPTTTASPTTTVPPATTATPTTTQTPTPIKTTSPPTTTASTTEKPTTEAPKEAPKEAPTEAPTTSAPTTAPAPTTSKPTTTALAAPEIQDPSATEAAVMSSSGNKPEVMSSMPQSIQSAPSTNSQISSSLIVGVAAAVVALAVVGGVVLLRHRRNEHDFDDDKTASTMPAKSSSSTTPVYEMPINNVHDSIFFTWHSPRTKATEAPAVEAPAVETPDSEMEDAVPTFMLTNSTFHSARSIDDRYLNSSRSAAPATQSRPGSDSAAAEDALFLTIGSDASEHTGLYLDHAGSPTSSRGYQRSTMASLGPQQF